MSESPKRFGRVWSVIVDDINGNNLFTVETPKDNPFMPEQLRVTFDTTQTIQQGFWYCDVSIYNLTSKLMNAVILQGMKLTLSAGYKSDNSLAILFQGSVLQPIFTRENGVDWKLTLHCVCGLIEVSNNFVAQTIAGGITQRQITAQMANACHFKLDASDIKDVDDKNIVSRASSFFGSPVDFFSRDCRYQ